MKEQPSAILRDYWSLDVVLPSLLLAYLWQHHFTIELWRAGFSCGLTVAASLMIARIADAASRLVVEEPRP